mgnify:CR=1 FL=1
MYIKKHTFSISDKSVLFYGGEDGIRTHARVTPTNDLANRPLEPTWVLLLVAER